MKISINNLLKVAYIYMICPVIIFLFGWIRWYLAIPLMIATLISMYCIFENSVNEGEQILQNVDINKLILIVIVIGLWVYCSGVGALVFQNPDHAYRNAIYEVLVNHDWPVVNEVMIDGIPSNRALIYYIGFWLPAALVGKYLGIQAGYLFQAIWAMVGCLLFYALVCYYRKKVSVWPLIVFIFFSGLDVVGQYMTNSNFLDYSNIMHIEGWSESYQFSSFTTQLFWVFNQAIPVWIATMMVLLQRNNKYTLLLLGCLMINSTLPFVGLLPIAVMVMFTRNYFRKNSIKLWVKDFWKDTFSFENVIGGIISLVTFIYLIGNDSGQFVSNTKNSSTRGFIFTLVIFLLVEVGAYFIILYKYNYKNMLYYITGLNLVVCALIKVGSSNDFCMRASIPALVVLYLLVVDGLSRAKKEKNVVILGALLTVLLLGGITPLHEINRTVSETISRYHANQRIQEESVDEVRIFTESNFSGNIEGNVFFQYIAK